MPILPYKILRAFATSPTSGNPAAVVLLPPAPDVPQDADVQTLASLYPPDDILQATASHSNQPMTGFALPLSPSTESPIQPFALRWFNPVGEAWLCGHAMMATSALLFAQNPKWEAIEYATMKHGKIVARRAADNEDGLQVSMDFPELVAVTQLGSSESERYLTALEAATKGWDQSAVLEVWDSPDRVLIELDAGFDLAKMEVECKKLAHFAPKTFVLAQVVPKEENVREQLRSRVLVIMPGFEHEDQVTGSAHCLIIPYFQTRPGAVERFKAATASEEDGEGNVVVRCRQVSPNGGSFTVTWRQKEGKVRITGGCLDM